MGPSDSPMPEGLPEIPPLSEISHGDPWCLSPAPLGCGLGNGIPRRVLSQVAACTGWNEQDELFMTLGNPTKA